MTGPITKVYSSVTFIGSGGLLGIIMFLQGSENYAVPPPDMSFMQWVDYYSSGLGALAAISAPVIGLIIFILRHRETKRHNKAMETKDD